MGDSHMELTSRGEGIAYRAGGREIEIAIWPGKPPRILAETIRSWASGQPLTHEEKSSLLVEVLVFAERSFREKAIVVINSDDPSKGLWERLCATHADKLGGVEYTSDRQQIDRVRDLLQGIPAGKGGIVVGDEKISDPAAIDEALARLMAKRRR